MTLSLKSVQKMLPFVFGGIVPVGILCYAYDRIQVEKDAAFSII